MVPKLLDEREESLPHERLLTWKRAHVLAGRIRGFVYFIRAENGGPVKIGSAIHPMIRRYTLQPGNPYRLVIMGCVYGDVIVEKQMHRQFKHLRLASEWFRDEPDLLSYIDRVLHAFGVPEEIYAP